MNREIMNYIPQVHLKNIPKFLKARKVLVIYGARRTGKTTLLEQFVKTIDKPYLFVNGEDIVIQDVLSSLSIEKLKDFIGEKRILIIDEAQTIPMIGKNLKLLVDHIPKIKILATGSSSFELAQNVGEPLTGRKYVLTLFPLSQMEISATENFYETQSNLENRLIYGSYPEMIVMRDNAMRQMYLRELVGSYLFKDILQFEGIRRADKLSKLLQLLAYQIGKEVSHTELGKQLGMGKNTVERYLDLLEKVFVIFKLQGFSRNLRKEISKMHRYYFVDLGIRNALINNFNALNLRNDIGQLWENYLIIERIKKQEYQQIFSNNYFWRTYDKQEIDFVEERDGELMGYEMKWQKGKSKIPKTWLESYSNASFEVISKSDYLEFIA